MCSMSSCDHLLHDLPASRLQWPHAAHGQEPQAFVLIVAIKKVDAVACDRVMDLSEWIEGFPLLIGYIPISASNLSVFMISSVCGNLTHGSMKLLLQEIRRNPSLWLLVLIAAKLAAEKFNHEAHALNCVL